ncbi:MAG: tRNA pseudouridine(38-40) synthase TruA [Acidimicrobiales bacterium]|jgi:tRNA pseudouridine38-40 synthase
MLLVAYDGSSFHGFAAQPGQRTVAGELGSRLASMAGHEVALTCAGRTDTGVHALAQVVHVDLDEAVLEKWAKRDLVPGMVLERLASSLTTQLAPSVAVIEARVAPEGFDARHSATARRYRYKLLRTPWPDPLCDVSSWHVPGELDLAAMRIGADALLGEHDFSSFCRLAKGESPPVTRRVLSASWAPDPGDARIWLFEIEANAFCHQMVRSVVGTLVAMGEGRIRAGEMLAILESGDRSLSWQPAPPRGLCLMGVRYPEDLVPEGVWEPGLGDWPVGHS